MNHQSNTVNDFENEHTLALNDAFNSYNIKATCVSASRMDSFDLFYVKILRGCKIRDLESISRELQLLLRLDSPPIFIPDSSTGYIKMVSAKNTTKVLNLKQILKDKKASMDCQIGIDVFGETVSLDLTKTPHLLIAGTTGSGKSVFLNVLVANILAMGDSASLLLADPKYVEFQSYDNVVGVDNDYSSVLSTLKMLQNVMEQRFQVMAKYGCRNIKEYNELTTKKDFRYIFYIIDEVADLMSKDKTNEFKTKLCDLAAKSRAAGIHLVIATQRPSVNVISGLIKANFPTRIVFKTSSATDSRVIIDQIGAENLLSRGDGMMSGYDGQNIVRFKSAYVTPTEALKYKDEKYPRLS
ncbi:MAG TPA: FtsK/SpoIIIE domain-containing protein [Candidatus Glassbacteria bacterium]|nr:FtsK/SpoIIIE domain-containing protein [Candidatus Glassbacteria bacterium]